MYRMNIIYMIFTVVTGCRRFGTQRIYWMRADPRTMSLQRTRSSCSTPPDDEANGRMLDGLGVKS